MSDNRLNRRQAMLLAGRSLAGTALAALAGYLGLASLRLGGDGNSRTANSLCTGCRGRGDCPSALLGAVSVSNGGHVDHPQANCVAASATGADTRAGG